jgi:hypothetical protein
MGNSREEAELEALQTDVMRFMAILGLCLAAIFSLVQGAAQEQAIAEQVAVEPAAVELTSLDQTAVEPPLKPSPEPVPEPASPARKAALPSAPVVGFTLEFASVEALEKLLRAGQVQLYARLRDQFWSVDIYGEAVPAEAPASYNQMDTETVPRRLRDSIPVAAPGKSITWGITLPARIIGQIQQLTSGGKGGNLLIGDDGTVVLEAGSRS